MCIGTRESFAPVFVKLLMPFFKCVSVSVAAKQNAGLQPLHQGSYASRCVLVFKNTVLFYQDLIARCNLAARWHGSVTTTAPTVVLCEMWTRIHSSCTNMFYAMCV